MDKNSAFNKSANQLPLQRTEDRGAEEVQTYPERADIIFSTNLSCNPNLHDLPRRQGSQGGNHKLVGLIYILDRYYTPPYMYYFPQ